MPESSAESLTPEKFGEKVGDDKLAAAGYPADEPMGVEDDSIVKGGVIARDDAESRDERLNPEVGEESRRVETERGDVGLIDPNVSPDGLDHEERLLADSGEGDTGPEADAMHVESAPDDA